MLRGLRLLKEGAEEVVVGEQEVVVRREVSWREAIGERWPCLMWRRNVSSAATERVSRVRLLLS